MRNQENTTCMKANLDVESDAVVNQDTDRGWCETDLYYLILGYV